MDDVDAATDGASLAVIEAVDVIKIGVHIGYLISNIEASNY